MKLLLLRHHALHRFILDWWLVLFLKTRRIFRK